MMETNADFVLENNAETNSGLILEKYEARNQGVPLFYPHWSIFIPTISILLVYTLCWILLSFLGMSHYNLGRLFIIIMAVFVPLMVAYAFLKFQTIRLQINDNSIYCHLGWPKELPLEISFSKIDKVSVNKSLSAKLFDQADILLKLKSGDEVVIANIAKPELARKIISESI